MDITLISIIAVSTVVLLRIPQIAIGLHLAPCETLWALSVASIIRLLPVYSCVVSICLVAWNLTAYGRQVHVITLISLTLLDWIHAFHWITAPEHISRRILVATLGYIVGGIVIYLDNKYAVVAVLVICCFVYAGLSYDARINSGQDGYITFMLLVAIAIFLTFGLSHVEDIHHYPPMLLSIPNPDTIRTIAKFPHDIKVSLESVKKSCKGYNRTPSEIVSPSEYRKPMEIREVLSRFYQSNRHIECDDIYSIYDSMSSLHRRHLHTVFKHLRGASEVRPFLYSELQEKYQEETRQRLQEAGVQAENCKALLTALETLAANLIA